MYSRVVTCNIKPEKVNEFRSRLNSEFLPRIQQQPGFVDNLESLDANTGQFCCMTLWQDKRSVENYQDTLFQEIATTLGPMMQAPPEVRTLPVENSSAHRIKAGRAAA